MVELNKKESNKTNEKMYNKKEFLKLFLAIAWISFLLYRVYLADVHLRDGALINIGFFLCYVFYKVEKILKERLK